MSCKPLELLSLAERLVSDEGNNEAQSRCAISRGYYAALHLVEETFPTTANHFRADGESSHADIIGRAKSYGNSDNPGRMYAAQIAKQMPRLRRLRNTADYELGCELHRQDALDALIRVKAVITNCDDVVRMRLSS